MEQVSPYMFKVGNTEVCVSYHKANYSLERDEGVSQCEEIERAAYGEAILKRKARKKTNVQSAKTVTAKALIRRLSRSFRKDAEQNEADAVPLAAI